MTATLYTPEGNDRIALLKLEYIKGQLEEAAELLAHGSNPTAEQAIHLGGAAGRVNAIIKDIRSYTK